MGTGTVRYGTFRTKKRRIYDLQYGTGIICDPGLANTYNRKLYGRWYRYLPTYKF